MWRGESLTEHLALRDKQNQGLSNSDFWSNSHLMQHLLHPFTFPSVGLLAVRLVGRNPPHRATGDERWCRLKLERVDAETTGYLARIIEERLKVLSLRFVRED
jgi:hypothetical protein